MLNTIIVLSIIASLSAAFMKADSNTTNNTTPNSTVKSYPAPVWTGNLDSSLTVALTLGTGHGVQPNSNFLIDVNSQMSYVLTPACKNLAADCSPHPYDPTKSSTYYAPTKAVDQNSTGQVYETIMGAQGAEVLNLNANLSTAVFEWNFGSSRVPKSSLIPVSNTGADGVLGFSFVPSTFTNFSNYGKPELNTTSGTANIIDAMISTANVTNSTRVVAIHYTANATIDFGGVVGYDDSQPKINCPVASNTTGVWSCALGAILSSSDATPNATSVDESNTNVISYFSTNGTANGTNVRFDTLHRFIVAPANTYKYFDGLFNLTGMNCTFFPDSGNNADFMAVTCPPTSSITQNNKSVYIVMNDKYGVEIPASIVTPAGAVVNNVTLPPVFGVRFWNDTTNTEWVLGTDFLNGHTAIFDMTGNPSVTVTGGKILLFPSAGSLGSKTVYIIVGIACAVAAIAIAIVIYCCCCKKNEEDDYTQQK